MTSRNKNKIFINFVLVITSITQNASDSGSTTIVLAPSAATPFSPSAEAHKAFDFDILFTYNISIVFYH